MNNSPALKVLLFFLAVVLLGAAVLSLGFCRNFGEGFSALEALFTSMSAVCGAGLSVVDIGTRYTFVGQLVILALIQVGALGYMLMSVIVAVLIGKMAIGDREIISDMFVITSFSDVVKLLKKAMLVVFSIELAGAAFLTLGFSKDYAFTKALYLGVFHSVSAFCNAGMSLFQNNLESFASNPLIIYPIIVLMFLGALGFFVLIDILNKGTKISYYSKIVLAMGAVLILTGCFIFAFAESFSLFDGKSLAYKINNSIFQVISAGTGGFNTINTDLFTNFTAIFIMVLMFIGAAPASSAGGVKVLTVVLVFTYVRSIIRNDSEYQFYSRTIAPETVKKAVGIFIVSIVSVLCIISLLIIFEFDRNPVKVAFEAVSAFGINGLSMGITPYLSTAGKILIIIAMFAGRIGVLTILVTILKNKDSAKNIRYPEGKVLIG
jgi:trk system potassium uptake protein TrkH